ncbi:MAG: hypothetical protein K0S73_1310 [Stenotrophomonas rhizophila]|jgi:hypothetical protein|uniref:DUF4177 domain-containing protein n=1 Tax=Stenotrophomonas rhizophila TaxID=216778 RepID=A0AAP5EF68_9GAMM|nr:MULTISPECIES: DUF4177 domain-containing protein [Stenotrophomonas]HBZ47170.1 DUF4177 domain-containing protein [Stenotrophomonas sp.]AOA71681.1 hypothetical protein BAY15_1247 [Stenotrophomonas rhizophila]MDF2817370.1 hypothetical protein [Stenotrophomonas rhizophila]MDQ1063384.1 hypothetical protein [Stenotrophomonas sp. SORGH_AS_0282]MDQ1109383.1 hypothetical protein [Stenotrophomonas rhizophila]
MSKRWSYLTVEVKPSWTGLKPEDLQAELNRQGQLGWELVNVMQGTPMGVALLFFKKEL